MNRLARRVTRRVICPTLAGCKAWLSALALRSRRVVDRQNHNKHRLFLESLEDGLA